MKGHQEMKKTNQALSKFLNFNIVSTLELFLGHFPDTSDSYDIRVPYREYLEYILVKLQGTSKLLLRILDCSLKSMRYQFALIRAGSFIMKGGIFMATLSRIWDVCRGYCEEICASYNELFQYRESLKYKSKNRWIPDDYEFPENLNEWLGLEYIRLVQNVSEKNQVLESFKDYTKVNDPGSDLQKATEEDGNSFLNSEDYGEPISRQSLKFEDFGEPISRTSFKTSSVKSNGSMKYHDIESRTSEKTLLKAASSKNSSETSDLEMEVDQDSAKPEKLKSKKSQSNSKKVSNSARFCEDSLNESTVVHKKLKIQQKSAQNIEDSINSLKSSPKPSKSLEIKDRPHKNSSHSLNSLKNTKSIKEFIKNESNYRKLNDSKSITIKKLKNKEWKEFKEDLKRKSVLMKENLLINYIKNCLSDD